MNEIFNPDAIAEGLADRDHKRAELDELNAWPELQSLTANIDAKPFPLDAFPDSIRQPIEEAFEITKAPIPLIANTALSAISMAVQSLADGERASYLKGPSGIYLMAIADSGERKSTCDQLFMKGIREYQSEQMQIYKPAIKEFEGLLASWEATYNGIRDKIRQTAKESKPTDELETKLVNHMSTKPSRPKVPSIIVEDFTPEALKLRLAKVWPSGGVISSEAGLVFGSHSMNQDSLMRTLATLNQLWDGTTMSVERATTESFEVKGARLTVGLQVQEATLLSFFEKDGGLSRGTGFLARVLLCCPESTQGQRPFSDSVHTTKALDSFKERIKRLLNLQQPIDDDGCLQPRMLPMTNDAKVLWVDTYNYIERHIGVGGDFHDIKDIASKAADNIMRLAVILQVFETESFTAITQEYIERSTRLVMWYLHEAMRFFGLIGMNKTQLDAIKLEKWLLHYCKENSCKEISRRVIQRNATPKTVRKGTHLDAVLSELTEAGRVKEKIEGKQKQICINPELLKT